MSPVCGNAGHRIRHCTLTACSSPPIAAYCSQTCGTYSTGIPRTYMDNVASTPIWKRIPLKLQQRLRGSGDIHGDKIRRRKALIGLLTRRLNLIKYVLSNESFLIVV